MENQNKIVEYRTLTSTNGPVDEKVNKLIAAGWQPYGSPHYYVAWLEDSRRGRHEEKRWAQSMVRYCEETNTKPEDDQNV